MRISLHNLTAVQYIDFPGEENEGGEVTRKVVKDRLGSEMVAFQPIGDEHQGKVFVDFHFAGYADYQAFLVEEMQGSVGPESPVRKWKQMEVGNVVFRGHPPPAE